MYTPEQQELLTKLENYKLEKKYSQNELAKATGISATALSQIKTGKYPSDPQGIFDTIANFLSVKDRAKLTYTEIDYAPTSISTKIYDIINVCQVKGGLAVAAGEAGIGKTKAAQKFVKDHPTNSVLITVNSCFTSIKSLLKIIADRIGAPAERSRDELWFTITKKLSDGMVLIFDEAQHLTLKDIEVLRSFSDYFNDKGQTLGICFIGNLETIARIGSKKAEFAQIANRTKQRKIYLRSEIRRDDIKKLFPILEAEDKEKEIDFLFQVAQTQQALRGTVNLFSNAYDNENYSYNGLVAMAKFMDMEL